MNGASTGRSPFGKSTISNETYPRRSTNICARMNPSRKRSPESGRRTLFLPRQFPPFLRFIEFGQGDGAAHSLQLRELPQLGVFPERVIDVHANGDEAAGAVQKSEV